jgi:hypothetical protein
MGVKRTSVPGRGMRLGIPGSTCTKEFLTCLRRGITLYLEYQSVCAFVRIGSPRPLYPKRVCSSLVPWNQKGGRQHSLAGEGAGGAPFGRLERKPSTLYTLCLPAIWLANKENSQDFGTSGIATNEINLCEFRSGPLSLC